MPLGTLLIISSLNYVSFLRTKTVKIMKSKFDHPFIFHSCHTWNKAISFQGKDYVQYRCNFLVIYRL